MIEFIGLTFQEILEQDRAGERKLWDSQLKDTSLKGCLLLWSFVYVHFCIKAYIAQHIYLAL